MQANEKHLTADEVFSRMTEHGYDGWWFIDTSKSAVSRWVKIADVQHITITLPSLSPPEVCDIRAGGFDICRMDTDEAEKLADMLMRDIVGLEPLGVSVIHICPVGDSGITSCCGKTPFDLPIGDRVTVNPKLVTCKGAKNE